LRGSSRMKFERKAAFRRTPHFLHDLPDLPERHGCGRQPASYFGD
jgi:hypothetical protein